MSELDRYTEEVASRKATQAGAVSFGSQLGVSRTVGGGQQEIPISSNIDSKGNLKDTFAVVAIPDDHQSNISSDKSETKPTLTSGVQTAFLGNAGSVNGAGSGFGGSDITR